MEEITENLTDRVNHLVVKKSAELCVIHIDLLFRNLMDVLSENEAISPEIMR